MFILFNILNMKKLKTNYELLAPAGDFNCLTSAIKSGADSVYFGIKDFNMRSSAKNFNIKDLPEIKKLCSNEYNQIKDVKKYLTLNTIIYDNEIPILKRTIKSVKNYVDAIICWDFSVINLCKKYNIPFHISTQASVSNLKSVNFYKQIGAQRIVLARELNLNQIKKIIENTDIEIEVFAHGAMCVSVSGRCFTSQFQSNKSANRGECMQPCRRHYFVKDSNGNELKVQNNYIFSAKDLCTLPFIEQLKQAGVRYFKIEGRNKEPEYVSTVVKSYRKAIDNSLNKTQINKELDELKKVYNRGFSTGFYLGLPTSDDLSNSSGSNALFKKEFLGKVSYYYPKIKVATIKIQSNLSLKKGDEILIIGKKTGVLKNKIKRLEINKIEVAKATQGQEVGIQIDRVGKGDEVYLIVKK